MIRREAGQLRYYPDSIIAALEKKSGAPGWLCELVWVEALEDRARALELLKRLQAALPATRDEAMAALAPLDTPRQLAIEDGRARARDDLQNGKRYRLTAGLLKEPPSFCPMCCVRIAWTPGGPDRCAACETPLFHTKSTGCRIEPRTRPFIEGYRAEVDAYIRKHFPEFHWEDVGC